MGSFLSVAKERRAGFLEGYKQGQLEQRLDQEEEKVQKRDHTFHEEMEGSLVASPCSVSSRNQPCQGRFPQKLFPDGLSNDAEYASQLLQEKRSYKSLYEEMQERCRVLLAEIESQRQHITGKEKEILGLQHHIQELGCHYGHQLENLEQHITRKKEETLSLQHRIQELEQHHSHQVNALNEKVKEHQKNCRDLSLKIERAEHLHSQQSMADSGSYQDSAATPPLLQAATDAVKDAITAYASELLSSIKKNSVRINHVRMNINLKDAGQIIKVALQSLLCQVLFKGFEDPFYGASDGIPLFVKPASRKVNLFLRYKRFRDLDARQMLNEETEFSQFFDVKESALSMLLREQLFLMDDVQKAEDFIASELCSRDNNLYNKLLRLVKAVWLLHKLAFSFEPSAEIIRVGHDSPLDDDFMENVGGDDDEEEDDEEETFAERFRRLKEVRFMCVPGFIVRHTIIKARVFCMERSEHSICRRTDNPTPMTLG